MITKSKIAIFISDVGFGHYIRQCHIIRELILFKKFEITVFSTKFEKKLKKKFRKKIKVKKYKNHFNLISNKDGSFSKKKTIKFLKNFDFENKKKFKFLKSFNFVISDFVFEIFPYLKKEGIPSIGVCHFRWSWFFSISKFPRLLVNKIKKSEEDCTYYMFPPITPSECYRGLKSKKFKKINFIGKKVKSQKLKKMSFLIMDNGKNTLKNQINNIVKKISELSDFRFYIDIRSLNKKSKKIVSQKNHLNFAYGEKGMQNYISKSCCLICRAGYNSISESLINYKPAIFFSEKNNKEINFNLNYIKKKALGVEITEKDLGKNFHLFLKNFINKKSFKVLNNIKKNKFKNDGAKQVVKYLINYK